MNDTPIELLLASLEAKKARANYLQEYFKANFKWFNSRNMELRRFLNEQVDLDTEIDILEWELTKKTNGGTK